MIYRNESIFNTSINFPAGFQDFHHGIVNLLEFSVSSNNLLSSRKMCDRSPNNNLSAKTM